MSIQNPPPAPPVSPPPRTAETERITAPPMRVRFVSWIIGSIPTLMTLALLAGLGWWGHHSGWAMPKFAELSGATTATPDDWCEEHGVPESMCVECNPDDYPQRELYGWCRIHGVHECVLDHPDVAQLRTVPQIEARDVERADRALNLKPRPENNFACQNPGRRIQFASRDAAVKAGVDVEPVTRETIIEAVQATGEIRYDETRLARLASKAGGSVWRVEKQVGDAVQQGDLLALVDAMDVGLAKAELQQALAEWQFNSATQRRLKPLEASGGVSGSMVLDAEKAVRTSWIRARRAHQSLINLGLPVPLNDVSGLNESELARRIRFLGIPEETSAQFDPNTTTSNLLPIKAPLSGVVVSRDVVAGEVVDTRKPLFTVADTSQMWLLLNIPLEESQYVNKGQKVGFVPDGNAGSVVGTIDWKSTSADTKTRTISVRATLQNRTGGLLNETFGIGTVVLRDEPEAIVVPNEAVQWDGSCSVVFVRDKAWFEDESPKLFHTRSVRTGARTEAYTEIIAGVLPGEVVATLGSDVLRAQLLKNNLGAG
jgi:membrane fusion protein, heavy metal efflux system